MKLSRLKKLIISLMMISFVGIIPQAFSQTHKQSGTMLTPELVAEYIFSIIEADRTLYARYVVERMQNTGTVIASEGWEHRHALPLPAQMLQMSGVRVEQKGLGLRYRLVSLSPIYEKNGPANEFERDGLERVQQKPDQPFTGYLNKNGTRYFQAIYADRAVSKACVNCHNTHILSSKRDYKLGDVMGGVIISFPVE